MATGIRHEFPYTTATFWSDIHSLVAPVYDLLISDEPDLPGRVLRLRDKLTRRDLAPGEMTERILKYADHLLRIQTRYPPDPIQTRDEHAANQLLVKWLDKTAEVLQGEKVSDLFWATEGLLGANQHIEKTPAPPARGAPVTPSCDPKNDFYARRDEILMEALTAVWLALYFLGIPFVQPWERVRRMADERGGYPSGACVTKYIGDIYRTARLEMARDLKAKGISLSNREGLRQYDHSCQVLVLSYSPFSLLKRLMYRKDDNRTPAAPHLLGRCYALLQMRLYVREGFPLRYFVSKESLTQNWANLLKDERNGAEEMLHEIPGWLRTALPRKVEHQSVQLLLTNEKIAGMATCILGRELGMYVLDTTHTSIPFAGNHLTGALLHSYREKLNAVECGTADGVLELSRKNDDEIIESLRPILMPASTVGVVETSAADATH